MAEGSADRCGLHELVRVALGISEVDAAKVSVYLSHKGASLPLRTRERLVRWAKELSFWEEYSRIYRNLEKARPYSQLREAIRDFIKPKSGDVWLDAGCGPAQMSLDIWVKSQRSVRRIVGLDLVLSPARKTVSQLKEPMPIELVCAHIGERLPFPDEYFDGITANLVLPYVTDFEGETGIKAFERVLQEIWRILKPTGQIVWSTPVKNVHFGWVFLASLPDMLNIYEYVVSRDVSRIQQGTRILRHALEIQQKGKQGTYSFLSQNELEKLLKEIGFENLKWKRTFAAQALVNSANKAPV